MNDKYAIINIETIQKRIEELNVKVKASNPTQFNNDGYDNGVRMTVIKELKQIVSKSTPLIPVIQESFGLGAANHANGQPLLSDYINNLKLYI